LERFVEFGRGYMQLNIVLGVFMAIVTMGVEEVLRKRKHDAANDGIESAGGGVALLLQGLGDVITAEQDRALWELRCVLIFFPLPFPLFLFSPLAFFAHPRPIKISCPWLYQRSLLITRSRSSRKVSQSPEACAFFSRREANKASEGKKEGKEEGWREGLAKSPEVVEALQAFLDRYIRRLFVFVS
jgi:hypothetical protein